MREREWDRFPCFSLLFSASGKHTLAHSHTCTQLTFERTHSHVNFNYYRPHFVCCEFCMIALDDSLTFSEGKYFFHWLIFCLLREFSQISDRKFERDKRREGNGVKKFIIALVFNIYFFFSQTPLHNAATNGLVECVNILIKHGADLEAKNVRKDCAVICYKYWGLFVWVWDLTPYAVLGEIYLTHLLLLLSYFS